MFIGEYNHSIDAKGRLIMPSKFRGDSFEIFYVTKGLDGCLRVYLEEEWSKFMSKINALPDSDKNARLFKREFLASSIECEVDKQGRILISSKLRDFAHLTKDVVIIGVSNYIEIWDKDRWNEYNSDDNESLEELAEKMSSYGL